MGGEKDEVDLELQVQSSQFSFTLTIAFLWFVIVCDNVCEVA